MNPVEAQRIKDKTDQFVGEVIAEFTNLYPDIEVPRQNLGRLSKQYAQSFVDDLVAAREQEIDQAEATIKGSKKDTDWKAYRKDRKAALLETRKQLKMYVTKPNKTDEVPTTAIVDEGQVS